MTSFVRKDMEILSSQFQVEEFFYSGRPKKDLPRLIRRVISNDLTFSWFAWDNAAWTVRFSRLFGKKSIVVAGGFDVASVPEIDYGNLLRSSSARRTRYALNRADLVLAVSESTYGEALEFCGRKDIKVVHHGFDSQKFFPGGQKERLVISVGDVSISNMLRKGLETFVEAARDLPDVPFALIGRVHEDMKGTLEKRKPDNLQILGRVSDSDLLSFMQRSRVYVQVSAHEGFGCSLAEAMLCECLPVVTRRGAIPEVVGDCGYYVPFRNPYATSQAIREALDDRNKGKRARERIAQRFPLERRRKRILELVHGLVR
ncbi:MAG: glycosyltransferase family 4 protein [Thermoplasmata archaeon]